MFRTTYIRVAHAILNRRSHSWFISGGKKGGLFYDVQNLSRVWNHPYILKMAKTKADLKAMFEDDIGDDGNLKDFIDDCSGDEASTSAGSATSDDDDVEMLEDQSSKRRVATRGARDKDPLVTGLEQVREEQLKEDKGWWHQFLAEDDNLEDLELGSKMILLMDILKECEMLGDKVLVFSQSLLSLDLIEEFLQKIDA
jgi:transcriptional regulator ATRX